MNFEEIYGKYKNGTATDEEKRFVEAEIIKARKISAILDEESYTANENILLSANNDDFVKARRKFNKKNTIKTIIIVVCCVVFLTIICIGTIWGIAIHYASKLIKITDEEAIEYAKQCVYEYDGTKSSSLIVDDVEMEIDMKTDITESSYTYEVDLRSGKNAYKIDVNANSGYAKIINVFSGDNERLPEHDYEKSEDKSK